MDQKFVPNVCQVNMPQICALLVALIACPDTIPVNLPAQDASLLHREHMSLGSAIVASQNALLVKSHQA
jgi:hypothetical protein